MSTTNLRVTELDFLTIKENLKNYLKTQTEFQDYDFEASGLNVLLDVLSYNTHYNAYYLNMVANESFLDSAKIRQSVVSHAKLLGYVPFSTKASSATINYEVFSTNSNEGTLLLPRGFSFSSNQIDDVSYNFVILDDAIATKANSSYYFENLKIYEGNLVNYEYVYNQQTNPKQIFILPDVNIDTETIKVYVTDSSSNTQTLVYNKVEEILELNFESEVFFIQESKTGFYEIYFGNGVLGKSLTNGNIITISYLVTNSSLANKASDFVSTFNNFSDSLGETFLQSSVFVVQTSIGGIDRESIDSIKFNAPIYYAAQNRLVTNNDYQSYLFQKYPGLEDVSVWGGEEENPPIYGKVFVSLKPKENYYISETEKTRIVETILRPKSIISMDILVKDPEYLYLKLIMDIKYDPKRTLFTIETLKQSIRTIILNYIEKNVNKFEKTFVLSKLQEEINNFDKSIIGVESNLRLEKRFKPEINVLRNYTINFERPLTQGTILNRLISDEFDIFDSSATKRKVQIEEILESYSGLSSILITDPGSGYLTAPKVIITGDGTGATATAKVVNGRVQSIEITNRGINYTKATITISGGNGFGATAIAIVDNKFGELRTIYYNEKSERIIVNPKAGTINYDTGEVNLVDLKIVGVYSNDGTVKLNVGTDNTIIESLKNTIVTIDKNDLSSISINLIT